MKRFERKGLASGILFFIIRISLLTAPLIIAFIYKMLYNFSLIIFAILAIPAVILFNEKGYAEYRNLMLKKQMYNFFLGIADSITWAFPLILLLKFGVHELGELGTLTSIFLLISAILSLIVGKVIDKVKIDLIKISKAIYILLFLICLALLLENNLPMFILIFSIYNTLVGQLFTLKMTLQSRNNLDDLFGMAGRELLINLGRAVGIATYLIEPKLFILFLILFLFYK